MKNVKRALEISFGFSAKEANGFIVLMLINLLLFGLVLGKPWLWFVSNTYEEDQKKAEALLLAWENQLTRDSISFWQGFSPFEVQKATQKQWEAIGFDAYLAKRIKALANKPNGIINFDSFLSIKNMDTALAIKLKPYLIFNNTRKGNNDFTSAKTKTKQLKRKDINMADTTELKTVFGIGSKLARRIILYRQQLGGFVKEDQLFEVFKMDSVVAERVFKSFYISETFIPNQIMINRASLSDLLAHPYLTYKTANAIYNYRKQHGPYKSAADLALVKALPPGVAEKLIPYISFAE